MISLCTHPVNEIGLTATFVLGHRTLGLNAYILMRGGCKKDRTREIKYATFSERIDGPKRDSDGNTGAIKASIN